MVKIFVDRSAVKVEMVDDFAVFDSEDCFIRRSVAVCGTVCIDANVYVVVSRVGTVISSRVCCTHAVFPSGFGILLPGHFSDHHRLTVPSTACYLVLVVALWGLEPTPLWCYSYTVDTEGEDK